MNYLTLEEILRLHYQLIADYGGLHGVRNEGHLQSVVEAPRQSLFGQDQYPTTYQKAAVYIRNIIADQPFSDGNKRTGVVVGAIFLSRNGLRLTATKEELEEPAVLIAIKHLDVTVIANWLEKHCKRS